MNNTGFPFVLAFSITYSAINTESNNNYYNYLGQSYWNSRRNN